MALTVIPASDSCRRFVPLVLTVRYGDRVGVLPRFRNFFMISFTLGAYSVSSLRQYSCHTIVSIYTIIKAVLYLYMPSASCLKEPTLPALLLASS